MQKAAAAYLKPSNRTLGVFVPTAKPDRAEVPAAGRGRGRVKDYKGDAAIAAGEAFDPSPANIEARTKRSELPGGAEARAAAEEDARRDGRRALTLRFGDEKSLMGKSTAADLAARHADARHARSTRASRSRTSSTA